ncbi:MAG: TIGR00341 family protein [Candidatus Korobacteraceae bacterium]
MHSLQASVRDLFRSHEEIYAEAYENRQFNAVYFAMLVFACLIALLGLLLNSPAVIIGAMLISPLMGPILSCGLALTLADWPLGRKAARNVGLSVVETIAIAALATWMSPLREPTAEILARTSPNLMDLLVALFSGIAGTLALSTRKVGMTIVPGVAIATAVMPPLATTGYGIATGQWAVAGGAFMLFFTNLTTIAISASLVFLAAGFRPQEQFAADAPHVLVRYRVLISALVLVVLSIPLMRTLLQAAQQVRLRKEVQRVLLAEFDRPGDKKLGTFALKLGGDALDVDVAVQTSTFIDATETNELQERIGKLVGRNVRLRLEQLQLARKGAEEEGRRNFLLGGNLRTADSADALFVAGEVGRLQERVREFLQRLLAPAGLRDIQVISIGMQPDSVLRIEFTGAEQGITDDSVWRVAVAELSRELGGSIHLLGSVMTSSQQLRYEPRALYPQQDELKKAAASFGEMSRASRPLKHQVIASAGADSALAARRLRLLQQQLAISAAEAIYDAGQDLDMVLIRSFQSIDVANVVPRPEAGPASASASEVGRNQQAP